MCGTDGKTYGNMCGLEAAACHTKHFKLGLKHLGECKLLVQKNSNVTGVGGKAFPAWLRVLASTMTT